MPHPWSLCSGRSEVESKICISNTFQVMLLLLGQDLHSENQYLRESGTAVAHRTEKIQRKREKTLRSVGSRGMLKLER